MAIYVTRPYLPPVEEYIEKVKKVFDRGILTNHGPEVEELEKRIKEYLGIGRMQYVTNGTIAIQMALRALDITEGEVITTPFTFVATLSSILWERCKPVFVDIEPDNFTINPKKIEKAITSKTKAILPVHVFGYACDVEAIERIAKAYNLRVIYDAAHAFGSKYNGKSLCSYGDVSTVSFHATKLFHTIEGGACIAKDPKVDNQLGLIKKFGCIDEVGTALGINGKQDELNAAMGVLNIEHIKEIIAERKRLSAIYDSLLMGKVIRPKEQKGLEYNYAYYPVLFESETKLKESFRRLESHQIYARRYFYPSLNKTPIVNSVACPVSEDVSSRVACLPLYVGLNEKDISKICECVY